MHLNKVEDFMRHRVEAWSRLDIVVVVVGDENTRGVHGKRPEAVKMDLLAQLQGCRHQHEAAAEAFGPDALHRPESLHVQQILWVKEEDAPLRVKVVQHVLDSEGHVGVPRVVEGRKHHGGVLVILEHFVERASPFLQLLKSAEEERLFKINTKGRGREREREFSLILTAPLGDNAGINCNQVCFCAHVS